MLQRFGFVAFATALVIFIWLLFAARQLPTVLGISESPASPVSIHAVTSSREA